MELLQRLPLPRRLAARVWLFTLPSGLVSFERRQNIPRLPIGRARLLGLPLIAAGLGVILRGRAAGENSPHGSRGIARFRESPAVGGALLLLGGVGLLFRSLTLTTYAMGLALAFARSTIELEEPRLPGREGAGEWDYDDTQV